MQFKLPGDWKTFNNFFFIRVKLVEIIHLKLDPILFPPLRFTSRIWTLVNKKRVQTLLFNGIIAAELEGNLGKHLESREIFLEKRISRQRERERMREGKKIREEAVDLGSSKGDVSSNGRLMDLSIPVRVEMKYAGGSLAAATWDDRRPICVRRPEATGALLMRGPDSSLSVSLSPPRKLHVTRTNVLSRVISPRVHRICRLTFLRKHPPPIPPRNAASSPAAPRGFSPLRNHRSHRDRIIELRDLAKISCEDRCEGIEGMYRGICGVWIFSLNVIRRKA